MIIFLWLIGWAITCGMEPLRTETYKNEAEEYEADIWWIIYRLLLLIVWPFRLGRLLTKR